jgi:signal transduction histidine kinase
MRVKPSSLYLLLPCAAIGALLASIALHHLWPEWRWHQEPFHSTMEALGGLAALAMAGVLLLRREEPGGGKLLALGSGFLGMGLLEAFHAAASPGNGFVLLRNVASLAGGLGFGLVWMAVPGRPASRLTWLPWIVAAGASTFGIWTLSFPEQLPEMIRNGEFTPTAVAPQSLACLLFFAAVPRFLLDFHESGPPEDYLFAALALMFGLAELVFMYSVPWDVRWWFWHLLRLMACLLVLGYVGRGYLLMISDLKGSLAQTKQAETTLRQVLDDRERIAQDLHDGSIQSLFAIGLGLERCRRLAATEPAEVMAQLGAAIADLKLVIRDLRGYIVGLEPPVANGREMEAALVELVRSMDNPSQLHFALQIDPSAADRVTSEQAAHLLAVAREAMSNSLRHSSARTGALSLHLHDGQVRLVVEDDGVGFQAETVRERGHGLKNMAARARRLGGRFEVRSGPGQGTTVIFELSQEPSRASA